MAQHAFQDEKQPFSAGIDYPGLFQDWEQFWCGLNGLVGSLHDLFQDVHQVRSLFMRLFRGGRAIFCHRQNGALDRAHHTFIGRVASGEESVHQAVGIQFDPVIQGACEAAP